MLDAFGVPFRSLWFKAETDEKARATVMPHNLYLHSGLVQTHAFGLDLPTKREAQWLATWHSTIALMFALTINASIVILAATTFYTVGRNDVAEIDKAHLLLEPLLGSPLAPILFGVA
jgi:manganese transport protein